MPRRTLAVRIVVRHAGQVIEALERNGTRMDQLNHPIHTLGDLLPAEFIGIGMNDGPFTDRTGTLDGARAFHEGGGRLVRLTFPETQQQRFGDVVVLYGRYEAVIESGGAERTMRGRLAHTARPR